MRLTILFGLTLFIFLLVTGCAFSYRAEIYPIPPDLKIKEFQGEGKAISVESEPIEGWVKIGKANLNGYYADLNQVTDVTVSFLIEELSKRGFSVQRDAPKSITLNVNGMNVAFMSSRCQCTMRIEYETSDGRTRIFSPYDLSPLYPKACNGAIAKGIADLLNDEKLINFLISP